MDVAENLMAKRRSTTACQLSVVVAGVYIYLKTTVYFAIIYIYITRMSTFNFASLVHWVHDNMLQIS